MLGVLFVYSLFIAACVAALLRPYWGILGFYSFVFLEPKWNWRWSVDQDTRFQIYIVAFLIAGFFLSGTRGNKITGWLKGTSYSLLLFTGIVFLSASQSISDEISEYYVEVLWKIILIALITIRVIDTPRKAWLMLWMIVIMQGYNSFRINEQYFIDGYSLYARRPWGEKGDNNLYSIFTLPAMAAALGIFAHSPHAKQRLAASFIFMLQAHQLMLMESRGTMIGGIVLGASALLLMPKTKTNILWAFTGAILIIALIGPSVQREFMSAFESEGERDSSAQSRIAIWNAGLRITADHPWLGVGPYAGQLLVPAYAKDDLEEDVARKGLHNLPLEISTGCGIPGLVAYLLFFLIPWWNAFKLYRHRQKVLPPETAACCFALICGIPGYFSASMFSSGALLESSYALTAACAGGIYSWQQANRFAQTEQNPTTAHATA